jgi:hypothetical protein
MLLGTANAANNPIESHSRRSCLPAPTKITGEASSRTDAVRGCLYLSIAAVARYGVDRTEERPMTCGVIQAVGALVRRGAVAIPEVSSQAARCLSSSSHQLKDRRMGE